MTVKKRGNKWYYDFFDKAPGAKDSDRYRGVIPLARTKHQAQQAEAKIRREMFEDNYGTSQMGQQLFSEFVTETYLPWAKVNKRTWQKETYIVRELCQTFTGKRLFEVSPLAVERLKSDELKKPTNRGSERSAASVNAKLSVLSSIFTLAVDLEAARINPCRKVKLLALDNRQYRYLLWEEEPRLLEVLTNPIIHSNARTRNGSLKMMRQARARLHDAIVVALGLGPRRSEQLRLQAQHCDFTRREVFIAGANDGQTSARGSKPQKGRWVPMNDDVYAVLQQLCRGKRRDQYLFENQITGRPFIDFKKGFQRACADAGIENFTWRNLRDTFGTRLGEAGHNAYDIADLMGHGDIRTTRRYVRTEPRKHEAVKATMLSNRKVVA